VALFDLGGLDPPGGIGDVRRVEARAGAEELQSASRARGLDDGVLEEVARPKGSATAVEKGKTVEDPTMRIWSRASAGAANSKAAARYREMRVLIDSSFRVRFGRNLVARCGRRVTLR